jgi:hypothetical protein
MKRWIVCAALAAVGVLAADLQSRIFVGVITETMCKKDHGMMGGKLPDAKCVIGCVKADKNVKYALHDGKNIYVLSDQQTPEKFAAQKVRVKGVLYEKTKILKVESMEAAK